MKKLLILFLLFSLSACATSQADKKIEDDKNKRADLHYRLGLDALHKGTIPKAFEELLLADKIQPNQPMTLDALAYAWRLRGNNKKAEEYYERAIQHNATAATMNNYGSLLVALGKYDEAVKQLNTALEDPRYRNQALAFVNLGDAYTGLKNLEKAVASYRKAHLLEPNWSYPQLREAEAYVQFNRPNYAQALYETLLRKDPANQQALIGLIALLKDKSKADKDLLTQYIQSFIQSTPDELQKAWAKDELYALRSGR